MKLAVAFLAVALIGLLAGEAAADCCKDCGCQCDCCKVCRCVPTTKKVTKICYDCEDEDFCIPGHSKICGYKCVCPHDDCDEGGCDHHGIFSFLHDHARKEPIWQPTCAKVHTRSRLVKKEIVKEVPSWKWEVVDLCPKCKACSAETQKPGDQQVQAPAERPTEGYYSAEQGPALPTVAQQPAVDEQAELASHNAPSKLKQMLSPFLAK